MKLKPPYVIWARESRPPNDYPVLLWNSFGHPNQHESTISLPTFIEKNAEQIRSHLLAFLCVAKDVSNDVGTLESQLQTSQGLSTWWLSFPSLKQWGKRQSIPIACRLIAIEQIVGARDLAKVNVESDDKSLEQLILRSLGQGAGITHRARRVIFKDVVHPLRAIGSLLRYALRTRSLWSRRIARSATSDVAFFDYYSNVDGLRTDHGNYQSPYWGLAPSMVGNPDWYHIFPRNISHRDIVDTRRSILTLNSTTHSRHVLFLHPISISGFLNVARTYISQLVVHRRFDVALLQLSLPESELQLWHVFKDEWDDSIVGSTAIRHLILLDTTERIVQEMPQYTKVFYLMENQPWELALTHCFRRHKKGELVGVAHSTIRFWDLRYFTDVRENSFLDSESNKPRPDRILVNGEIGRQLLLDNHFPEHRISVVEALRYMYLQQLRTESWPSKKTLLLLGDFLDHANEVLVKIFREAISQVTEDLDVKVRSHPICPLPDSQLGPLSAMVSNEPLSELLKSASIVVTTAASSSAAESAALGIPTIVVLDARSLNYSPFRQTGNVFVVEDSVELARLLKSQSSLKLDPVDAIFCLDSDYPRWRAELSSA